METTRDQRIKIILELKEMMKNLATINDQLPERNKQEIIDATDDIKILCELLNF